MKKRLFNLFLVLVMVVSMVPFSVFADGCAHTKTRHVIKTASCIDGSDNVVCKDCGEVLSTTVLKANEPHLIIPNINDGKCLVCNATCSHEDYEVLREDPATCGLTGYIWKKCNICQTEFNHETPADESAHTFVDGKCTACRAVCSHAETRTETEMANCAHEGSTKVICKVCNKVISETVLEKTNNHEFNPLIKEGKNCIWCDISVQAVCDHDYETIKEEIGTCTLPGYIWKKCRLCGKENNHDTTVAEGVHTYANGKCTACRAECAHAETRTETEMANCAHEGSTKVICKECALVLSETTLEKTNEHEFNAQIQEGKYCIWCGASFQDVCEHEYELVKAEPATCSMTGYAWEICKICGSEYNHETPIIASAHNFVNGQCSACFKPCQCDMERLDIKMPSCHEEGYRRVLCVKCGKILAETVLEKTNEHLFLDQYEGGKKCRLCDAFIQDVCEHDYETVRELAGTCIETGYIWKECKLCGKETNNETEMDPNGHDYMVIDRKEATCVEPAHVWKRCVLCANKVDVDEGEAAGHKYENGKCFCGEPDPNCPHTNHVEDKSQYRPATCTVDGVHVYDCPACGTKQRETIPMLGHDRSEKKVAATCTTNGLRVVSCTRCKQLLEEETLVAGGHNYENGKCACGAVDPVTVCVHPQNMQSTHIQDATCTEDGCKFVTCMACNVVLSREPIAAKGHTEHESVNAATCTEDGAKIVSCTTCRTRLSYEPLPATGHNYMNGVCSGCGKGDPDKVTADLQDVFIVG